MSTPNLPSFSSKTCLVTGGAGGVGKVIAEAFLRAGANVVVCDINQERLADASTELSNFGSLTTFVVDITREEEVQHLFDAITVKFGKLDILINNAGIIDRFQPVGDMDVDIWNRVIAINLTAPMLVSKLAVNSMLTANTGGCIINIASVAAKAGMVSGAAYATSKHGLLGLTKHTAAFYGEKGIGCVALMLGRMPDTNILESMTNAHEEGLRMARKVLSAGDARPVSMETVAGYCVMLAQDNCRLLNGACIGADGGLGCVLG
ncbi:uncharacterized protein PgNI_11800 [Pyricularia grisea]|uniref:Uncharacterized protein n=1 Tax=Pyricularia grisea TaxID=148305 RepID=A0A6P8AN93_PYRGI|nr:uncharacterized protein PgNI_11800 [Pyricularia grisea]TLD03496.1 hypothetical protein PgNI_11800 [Pyricularia grisea]